MKIFKKIFFVMLIFLIPLNVFAKDFNITSSKALLVNLNDNKILYEKNIHNKTQIASLTKIMTAIVVLDNVSNLDEKVLLKTEDFNGLASLSLSTSGLKSNHYYTYKELLYGLLLPSGADCAKALERLVAGTDEDFVNLMNKKAKELKMEDTNFSNSIGLDDKNNYSTAYDCYLMFNYALKNETFKKIVTTMKIKIGGVNLNHTINYYLEKYDLDMDYLLGGKTGTETKAGLCLASFSSYKDVSYILITLNAPLSYITPNHLNDAKTIYEYYLNNYSYNTIIKKGDLIYSLNTKSVKEKPLQIYADKSYSYYLENNYDKEKLKFLYEGINTVDYTFKKGAKLGSLKIYYDEELIDTIDISLNKELTFSFINFLKDDSTFSYSLSLFLLLLFLLGLNFIRKYKKEEEPSFFE